MPKKLVVWFEEVGKQDTPFVGGKGANLGEMTRAGIPIPYGFIVTVVAYEDFLTYNHLRTKIADHLKVVDYKDPTSIQRVSQAIKKDILKSTIPPNIAAEIIRYYFDLSKRAHEHFKKSVGLKSLFKEPLVAVRSSATAEDLPSASFAGQQATFLDVRGESNLIENVRAAWASLFEPRAIFYRHEQKIPFTHVGIAVPVQLMVSSTSSGVMFTIDPVTNEKSKIVIEAIFGLGELIVQGEITPDHFEVDKKSFTVINKKIADQTVMLVKADHGVKKVSVPAKSNLKPKITDKEVVEIAKLGARIEKHYFYPQDIEWAIEDGIVYIVQSRPITTIGKQKLEIKSQTKVNVPTPTSELRHSILTGDPASPGIAVGPVQIIHSAKEIAKIDKGEVLVAPETNPDYVPAMKKAVAIVTERGGRTSHAAIVSRELGIPAVVGAQKATQILKNEMLITVNGSTGQVYKGGQNNLQRNYNNPLQSSSVPKISEAFKTATKMYVNLAEPSRAAQIAKLPVDGVGLLRAEFMIAEIGTHPKKFIADKRELEFISKLAEGLETIASAFYPRPVVYRATDFRTNEYRNLKGGSLYEPDEANPMLGFRGAARYVADSRVFELELSALKLVRNKKNLKNLSLMIPFIRNPKELLDVKKIVTTNGLMRSSTFKLWMMVEIPTNVILLDQYLDVGIDGVSIGSNDLTMLLLGTDRDNSEVAHDFNERDEAVLWALEKVVKGCSKRGVTSSICGQAASDYPDLVERLIDWGITSVSINSDAVARTREIIYNSEKALVHKRSKK